MKKATWIVMALCGVSVACAHGSGDLARDTYPESQAEVRRRLDDIWAAIAAKDLARLESYHLYGPKFTEFKDGAPRGDAEANKAGERQFFSALSDSKVDMKDLVVNVFGDVAIATFNGDFRGTMGGKPIGVKLASTMVFAKADGQWRLVHEHFSPIGAPPPGA
jgi:ketosteroid isomerase-like protein